MPSTNSSDRFTHPTLRMYRVLDASTFASVCTRHAPAATRSIAAESSHCGVLRGIWFGVSVSASPRLAHGATVCSGAFSVTRPSRGLR